jgi:glycosyltransferase involved in cell wall biosynthesis
MTEEPHLIGVLPTYRRAKILGRTLEDLGMQTRSLDYLIVVDNETSAETERVVASASIAGCEIEYLSPGENMGFAGGVAAGMRRALEFAADADWIVLLDDDDPPRFTSALERLSSFAATMRLRDPLTAAVGISGGWFDWRRGRMRRVADAQLQEEAIPLDHVAGNQLPFFLVGTVRRVDVFCDELFFGFSELEFGLRLWTSGYTLYGYGPLWLESRKQTGRVGLELKPSLRLQPVNWRDYYSLRNAIFILRRFGHRRTALRVTLVQGLAKPIVNGPLSPRLAFRHVRLNVLAIRDGWTDRMGRRVDPDGGRRAGKARGAYELSETPV